jgi:hypothetical protein
MGVLEGLLGLLKKQECKKRGLHLEPLEKSTLFQGV